MAPQPAPSFSARVIAGFVRPPADRVPIRLALLWILMLAIGFEDERSGVNLSLGIFYLLPILLGTAWHGRRTGMTMAVASVIIRIGGDALFLYPERLPLSRFWNITAGLLIYLFIVSVVDALLVLQRDLERKVDERTAELRDAMTQTRRLELEILETATRERSAFGRELHDGIGQQLVATALAGQVLVRNLEDTRHQEDAQAIVGWIEDAIDRTRKLARGLMVARIDPQDLARELDTLAVGASRGGVQCRLVHEGRNIDATSMQCAQLFRIAQEAVANSLRHAKAKAINITLASDDQSVCLAVEDDGCGLEPEPVKDGGIGLESMQHRASIIGGSLSIFSETGKGTRIICRLPRTAAV